MVLRVGQVWVFYNYSPDGYGEVVEEITKIEGEEVSFKTESGGTGHALKSTYFKFNAGELKGLNVRKTFENFIELNK